MASERWRQRDYGCQLRKVMLSGGGPGNGSMWVAPTKSARDLLPDAHFMMSTVLKLVCESNVGADSVHWSNSEMTLSPHASNFLTPPYTHIQSWTGTHAPTQGDCSDLAEPAQAEWGQVDKERPAPHMYEFETNDKGERVVKGSNLRLCR